MAKKKRSDGRFKKSINYNGKTYYVYGKSIQEVEQKAVKKRQELEDGIYDHENPRMGCYYQRWSDNRIGIVKESTRCVQGHFFNTIKGIKIGGISFEDLRIADVKPDDIRIIQKELLDSGNSAQTVNDKIAFISHMFNDALKERYIDYNPCMPIRNLKHTEKKARDTIHRALTKDETKAFFEAAENSYYYDIYRLGINTGMRIGEIGALYEADIRNDMIHIEKTVMRTTTGSYTIAEIPKTLPSIRTIPLNDSIREIIKHQQEINRMIDGDKIRSINDTIFKAYERGILLVFPIDRDIERICRRAGIEKFTTHAFRATFATRCIEQGINPRTIQDLLGHADYKLTMNLYGHVLEDTKNIAMQTIKIAL